MAIGGIYRVAAVGVDSVGSELVCVMHYKAIDATIFDTQAEDLAQAWLDSLGTLFMGCCAAGNALTQLQVRGVTVPTEGADLAVSPAIPGGLSGAALPPQTAPVITWLTGLVGRRYRGRNYLWPLSENNSNAGQIDATALGAMDDFGDAALIIGDGVTTATYQLVVYSRTYLTSANVTGHRSNPNLGTQRRRKQGSGS